MTTLSYRRLPGTRRTAAEVASLHLGPDHILQVRSTRINEEYQRFYFQDVEGIVLRKTAPIHYVWAAVIVTATVVASLVTTGVRWPAGLLGLGVVLLWWRGPSCDVQLQTGGATERLRSLHRWKTARRVIPMLREQIESVQGPLSSLAEDYVPAHRVSTPPALPFAEAPFALGPRRYDAVFFLVLLLIEALLLGFWLAKPSRGLEQAIGVAALMEFFGIVTLMVRQAQQGVPKAVRIVTYVAAGRWFLAQSAGVLLTYKAILFDNIRTTLDPLTFVRGTMTYVTLASVLGTAAAFLWVSMRDDDA